MKITNKQFAFVLTLLAWLGIWGVWIPHSVASLSQNALYLSEWATFLPEVRFGEMNRIPELLRLSLSLGSISLAIAAGWLDKLWLRIGFRLLALITPVVFLPPYPDILQFWMSPSYGMRFMVSMIGIAGILISFGIDRLPEQIRQVIVLIINAGAIWLAWTTVNTLRGIFSPLYSESISAGGGLMTFVVGLGLAMLLGGFSLLQRRSEQPV